MTEQEAKLKPCIGPAPQNTGELWNPGGDGVTRFGCAGSTCLAWRWSQVERSEAGQPAMTWPDLASYHEPDTKLIRHAFCGLAGRL